jgi:hypothetical protein
MKNKHNETEEHEDNKNSTESAWKEISKHLEGRSLLEIYMKASSIVTDNEILNFRIKRIRIKTGMNLLPLNNKNLSEDEKNKLEETYTKSNDALKNCFPNKRKASFSFEDIGNDVFEVYKISSQDLDEYHARPHDISSVLEDFKRQQFERSSMRLEEIDNLIQQLLMRYDVVPMSSPEIELDKQRTKMYQELGD